MLTHISWGRLYYPHFKDWEMDLTEILQIVYFKVPQQSVQSWSGIQTYQPQSLCLFL